MRTTSITLLAILLLAGTDLQAQDVDTTLTSSRAYFRDTLATTIDTIEVGIRSDEMRLDYHSIVAWTPSGTDTVEVFTLSLDGTTWIKQGLTDLSNATDVTQIIAGTAAKEFAILDPRPGRIRLVDPTSGNEAISVIFIVGGKRTLY